ncbi:flagellar biosynthesis protein FlhB [Pelotomaculum sp. PtaB.Bin117]|uniref:flagellar biosynthesis protein FlhB n=1 Tax=Pelotomaculum sp. PtaB.Bin117 TaxID=1811694 RepID=UPI0009C95745|nr:flagellar biosynthesis protein FlhB [Pelotomaculum sp. PtaB.Bin117]OPX88942.1 MAG: Flagellar biosynthetic protein FlhB [Pelotomaculum sp. PtaB.Bin117]
MAGSAQEKTEQATPKRLEEARRKGQVSKSVDLTGALCLMAIVVLLFAIKDSFFQDLQRYLTGYFGQVGRHYGSNYNPMLSITDAVMFSLKVLAPFFGVALMVVIASNVAQVGFLFSTEALRPKLDSFNPLSGLQRMFSRRSLVELVKSVLKFSIIGGVTYQLIRKNLDSLLVLFNCTPWGIYQVIVGFIIKVAFWGGLCYLVLSLLDYMYQRYEYNKNLMMSKQEVKDEFKQMEGDQQIKSRRREVHRSISMSRIAKEVPQATVVVTNPTRLAVALRYEQGEMAAPRLVAKGAGHFASRIKEIARRNAVPVIENKEVAQFIYQNVEIDQEIPLEIYQAVAQILAMVYRLKAKENYRTY